MSARETQVGYDSHREPNLVQHEILSPDELPGKGTLISIDAEFVSLQDVSLLNGVAEQPFWRFCSRVWRAFALGGCGVQV
jgi:hypothetical protein